MDIYSDKALLVLEQAKIMALKLGGVMDSIHLLYAMTEVENCKAERILKEYGITAKTVEPYLEFFPTKISEETILNPLIHSYLSVAQLISQNEKVRCGTEHILLAITSRNTKAKTLLMQHNLSPIEIKRCLTTIQKEVTTQPKKISSEVACTIIPEVGDDIGRWGKFLTDKKNLKIDKLIGREREIEQLYCVLMRRQKNNAILVGKPGVGKTAIMLGMAHRILEGNVPDFLQKKSVFSLNVSSLLAGASYRGDLEKRIDTLITKIKKDKILLFIDEIHLLGGGGNDENRGNLASILKGYLSGEIMVVGTTTFEEYERLLTSDQSISRTFTKIIVEPMSKEDTMETLRSKKSLLEKHFSVKIDDQALHSAVELSERYLAERALPDKAIDLVEEGCSLAKIGGRNKVTEEDVRTALSRKTGIPVSEMKGTEREKIIHFDELLKKRISGQSQAISEVSSAVKRIYAGLKDGRPYSFLFLGPTGVGKTEMAKAVAEGLFGDERELVRFDMSEYAEKGSVTKLIGAPPGYIGHDRTGSLTGAVSRKPYCVLLFDEVEKASPEVYHLFLQLLDDGRLTDNKGQTVDFSNTIVIMTGNIGASAVSTQNAVGFITEEVDRKKTTIEELKRTFPPEIINRINKIIFFEELNKEELLPIANKLVERIKKVLKTERQIDLDVSLEVIEYIAAKGYDKKYGARPMRRLVEGEIEDVISTTILTDDLKNCSLEITLCGSKPQIKKKGDNQPCA